MKSSSNYDFFAGLDEVGDFVRFLIERVSPYQTGHVLRLVDKHPDLYRTFKTIRRLTHRG